MACLFLRSPYSPLCSLTSKSVAPIFCKGIQPLHAPQLLASHSLCQSYRAVSSSPQPRSERGQRRTWLSFVLAAVVGSSIVYFHQKEKKRKEQQSSSKAVGKPLIGGPFCLVDHFGRAVTSASMSDKFKLIYFGFTFCPDICPIELEKMAKVIDTLDADKTVGQEHFQPLFISVDPQRDGVDQIREYLSEFHPRILGLTGTPEQITDCCRAFRVYSSKGTAEGDEDYLVDHSIFFYLIDPKGDFVQYYGRNKTHEEMSADIRKHVREYRGLKPPIWERISSVLK